MRTTAIFREKLRVSRVEITRFFEKLRDFRDGDKVVCGRYKRKVVESELVSGRDVREMPS